MKGQTNHVWRVCDEQADGGKMAQRLLDIKLEGVGDVDNQEEGVQDKKGML